MDFSNSDSSILSWNDDIPLLKSLLTLLNNLISTHINRGFLLDILHQLHWDVIENSDKNNNTTVICDNCTSFFHGINGFLDHITNQTGSLHFKPSTNKTYNPFHIQLPSYGAITITCHQFTITNMDKLTHITFAHPTRARGLNFSLQTQPNATISILTQLQLNIKPIPGGIIQGHELQESFTLLFNTSNLSLATDFDIGILTKTFQNLTIQDLTSILHSYTHPSHSNNNTHTHFWTQCLLPNFSYLNITNIHASLNLDKIALIPIESNSQFHQNNNNNNPLTLEYSNSLEIDLDQMLNNALTLFLQEYGHLVSLSISSFANGPIRYHLNQNLEAITQNSKNITNTCRFHNRSLQKPLVISNVNHKPNFFSFNQSNVVAKINNWFNKTKHIHDWNNIISCIIHFLQHNVLYPKDIARFRFGTFDISFSELSIHNIEKFLDFVSIDPVDSSHLTVSTNTFTGKGMTRTGDKLFTYNNIRGNNHSSCNENHNETTHMSFSVEILNSALDLNSHMNVSLHVQNFFLSGGSMLQYDLEAFKNLEVYNVLSKSLELTVPINGMGIFGSMSSFGSLCIGTNISTSLQHFSREEIISLHNIALNASSLASTILSATQNIANAIIKICLDFRNSFPYKDEKPQEQLHENDIKKKKLLGRNICFLMVTFLVANIIAFVCYTKNKISYKSRKETTEDTNLMNKAMMNTSFEKLSPLNSLMFHSSISNKMRIYMPVAILGTIAIFVASNLSTGASVDLVLTSVHSYPTNTSIPENGFDQNDKFPLELDLPGVFTFSLGKTVTEMFHARVYSLMLLVLVFSGVWPYVKLLLMFFAWTFPTENDGMSLFVFSPGKREKLLIWLDTLGKFSLVDSFVLVLMLVAFRFHFDGGLIQLDAFVTPMFGFYSFLFATISSLVIGHGIIFFHRHSDIFRISLKASGPREAIISHHFKSQRRTNYSRFSKCFISIWAALFALATCLMGIGVTVECFKFEFKGLAGVMNDQSIRSYSLINLGVSIPLSVPDPSNLGVQCIQWTYYFFALIMPFVCICVVSILLFVPFRLQSQQRLFVIAEICYAWSAIEVFLISVIASLIELEKFAGFIVGHHCDKINALLKAWFDDVVEGVDKCFEVKSTITPNSIILLTGTLMQCILIFYSLKIARQAIDERIFRDIHLRSESHECKSFREKSHDKNIIDWALSRKFRNIIFVEESESVRPANIYDNELQESLLN